MRNNGQVWIETVLYTLIGLALIGGVLAFIMPKINETKDKLAIEQTIDSLNDIKEKMEIIPGNVRQIDFTMKRGTMTIDSPNDKIIFVFDDVKSAMSEEDVEITQGGIKILTERGQKDYKVTLTLDMAGVKDLRYRDADEAKSFNASPAPYRLSITSKSAEVEGGEQIISFDEIS